MNYEKETAQKIEEMRKEGKHPLTLERQLRVADKARAKDFGRAALSEQEAAYKFADEKLPRITQEFASELQKAKSPEEREEITAKYTALLQEAYKQGPRDASWRTNEEAKQKIAKDGKRIYKIQRSAQNKINYKNAINDWLSGQNDEKQSIIEGLSLVLGDYEQIIPGQEQARPEDIKKYITRKALELSQKMEKEVQPKEDLENKVSDQQPAKAENTFEQWHEFFRAYSALKNLGRVEKGAEEGTVREHDKELARIKSELDKCLENIGTPGAPLDYRRKLIEYFAELTEFKYAANNGNNTPEATRKAFEAQETAKKVQERENAFKKLSEQLSAIQKSIDQQKPHKNEEPKDKERFLEIPQ